MKEGEVVLIRKTCVRRECQECENLATKKLTWLLDNSRRNPASSGYGKDDISWCEDESAFGCEDHAESIWRNPPSGMDICSMFSYDRMPHMFLYWYEEKLTDTMTASEFTKKFAEEAERPHAS